MNNKLKGILFLISAIVFEVISTTNIKLSQGFSELSYSIIAVVAIVIAMFSLANALNYIPLSVAYAIWVGVGTALIYVISIFVFDEPISLIKFIGVVLVIGGVVSLNFLTNDQEKSDQVVGSKG
ncbi:DMT family transporter [Alkalicoccobacillus murimartini]|uniref:Multidrug transporter EmrE-like cation transporter n=1 Tax=Alkalicoccobacillus murimartini TaxID=171685 RepID=A0ABT9YLD4_9BACI|nr:multidrug efflux SMR transporter [Alkalicoccobacillus murimartini]MDQ0208683.1 multidrug transporter EmrE-like cation transporter [Alkalicoccobacillus murimartini]